MLNAVFATQFDGMSSIYSAGLRLQKLMHQWFTITRHLCRIPQKAAVAVYDRTYLSNHHCQYGPSRVSVFRHLHMLFGTGHLSSYILES